MTLLRALTCGSAAVAAALSLGLATPVSADPVALEPIEELGKHVFFDTSLSVPGNKQGCVSCHDPKVGWVLPDPKVNQTTVGAPGAKPGAVGGRKSPSNGYASFSPPYHADNSVIPTGVKGGNFWDGRAEGCGAKGADPNCQKGEGKVSETITWEDLDLGRRDDPANPYRDYAKHLGPTADQALNPFPNDVEQNIREKNVCQKVKTAKYKALYERAFGEPIDCNTNPKDKPTYRIAYKRLAVALSAWQSSSDVNSFSSRRDACIKQEPDPVNRVADADGLFPCDNLEGVAGDPNLGHDIFYGRNDSGRNRIAPAPFPGLPDGPLNAGCAFCHNGVPEGDPADPAGVALHQIYADNAYHCIGVPYNREIPKNVPRGDKGLAEHDAAPEGRIFEGCFKTPTLRNVAKGEGKVTNLTAKSNKAFMHNGYLKSHRQVVHWYNTGRAKPLCAKQDATAEEAITNDCWPKGEFDPQVPPVLVGDIGLTDKEEEALAAYLDTLTDTHMPERP